MVKNELYHYGTKGQKWGIRNYQNADGSYTSKGQAENGGHGRYSDFISKNRIKTSKSKKSSTSINLKQNITKFLSNEKTKKAIKIGASVVAIIGIGYSLHYVNTIGGLNAANNDYVKNEFLNQFNHLKPNFSSLEDIPKTKIFENYFNEDHTIASKKLLNRNNVFPDNMLTQMVNAFRKEGIDKSLLLNYQDELLGGRTNNCMLCTTSLVMRLKGYYSEAAKTFAGQNGIGCYVMEDLFKNAKIETPKKNTINAIVNELSKSGVGSYGNLMITWLTGGGHSILYTVENDGVHFLDGQLNIEYTAKELFSKTNILGTQFARLDNCDPTDLVLKAVSKVGSDIIFA